MVGYFECMYKTIYVVVSYHDLIANGSQLADLPQLRKFSMLNNICGYPSATKINYMKYLQQYKVKDMQKIC